ncbi:MAG: superoxide dismutase family protein [Myxococcota bacterium]
MRSIRVARRFSQLLAGDEGQVDARSAWYLHLFGVMKQRHASTPVWVTAITAVISLTSAGCQRSATPVAENASEATAEKAAAQAEKATGPRTVSVEIQGKSGSELSGTASLTEQENGVKVTVDLKNAPAGMHGLHIHQKADCSADDGTSAGGHFSPTDAQHGLPTEQRKHLGDLGNIEVAEDGTGRKEITVEGANLEPSDPRSFLGRSVIVHAQKDDGGQPTGNAGARIGCGEIPKDLNDSVS